MPTTRQLNSFKRDYKRETKGKSADFVRKLDLDLGLLFLKLAANEPLPLHYRDHALSGNWADTRECHVRPDLLLIYRKPDQGTLELVRLGSHSELF
jgi:mRNA interferase YafQ